MDFKKELENLINTHNKENDSNTPDFILASYIENCLHAFTEATQQRETWHGRDARPSSTVKTQQAVENDGLKTCGYCGYENFKEDTHCHQCCNKF